MSDDQTTKPIQVDVNIKAEQINKMVVQAILDSSLGETIRSSIKSQMSDYNFRASVEKSVQTQMREAIARVIQSEEFKPKMKPPREKFVATRGCLTMKHDDAESYKVLIESLTNCYTELRGAGCPKRTTDAVQETLKTVLADCSLRFTRFVEVGE